MTKKEKERIKRLIEEVINCRNEAGDLRYGFVYNFLDMALVELKEIEALKGYSNEKRPRKKPL